MGHAPLKSSRYPALDYLRGLMALSVLVFHYDKWVTGAWDANSLQGRLGVYAVSAFFVLSGLTLSLVYHNRIDSSPASWAQFFRKRFFRIYPLLWLATTATLFIDDTPRSAHTILLNFSGLFGFVNPAGDIATGAWSIGCELVYYAFFPTLLWAAKRYRWLFFSVWALLLATGAWIAFAWYQTEHRAQAAWWEAYVQALNHAYFFVGGMAIGLFQGRMGHISVKKWRVALFLSALAFICWPIGQEAYWLVSGWGRVLFSVLTLLVVFAYFHSHLSLPGLAHSLGAWLGAISYGLYLIHPLAFRAVKSTLVHAGWACPPWGLIALSLVLSLALSHVSYHLLEKPLMRRS